MPPLKLVNVVGARPNFMKIAPLMKAYGSCDAIDPMLVHTGQHYDERMSDLMFRQLGIPEPDEHLGVKPGTHASQTAEIMTSFERVLLSAQPDAVLVVGDVNSTIACGLVAAKMGIKLIHVEAGLRSFDRSMPEEINRVLTDVISDLLFCTEQSGMDNLRREGVGEDKIFFVGNLMIDTLLRSREEAESSTILEDLSLEPDTYATVTLHRPSNVDDDRNLASILMGLNHIQNDMPVVFPCHPRTKINLDKPALRSIVTSSPNLRVIGPLGYLDFIKLMSSSCLVLTDSGGIQEETTILKVPCLTLRETTERPVTLEMGANRIVGTNTERIVSAYADVMNGHATKWRVPPLWDGLAAQRIVKIIVDSR